MSKNEIMLNKSDVIEMLDNEILKKKNVEAKEAERKKQIFIDMFEKHFEKGLENE